MAAPAVQSLQDAVAQQTAANQPNLDNLTAQDQNITDSGVASKDALTGEQATQFGNITQSAQGHGVAFSGIPLDEQAKYTANTYLPAVAKLNQAIVDSRTALAGQKATMLSSINSQGLQTVNTQKSALQNWQDQQDAFARSEQVRQSTQNFQDQQRQATENFTGQQNADSRANALSVAGMAASAKASEFKDPGYKVTRDPSGGLQYSTKGGQPLTMAQYLSGKNADGAVNQQDAINLLSSSGNPGDANIIADINSGASPEQLAQKYPHVFGG